MLYSVMDRDRVNERGGEKGTLGKDNLQDRIYGAICFVV